MTDAIAVDTHRFVKRLTESGFTEKQAETLAEEHVALLTVSLAAKFSVAAVQVNIAPLSPHVDDPRREIKVTIEAIKAELKILGLETKAGLDAIQAELRMLGLETKASIEACKADFLKWMFVALTVHGSAIVALVKLLSGDSSV